MAMRKRLRRESEDSSRDSDEPSPKRKDAKRAITTGLTEPAPFHSDLLAQNLIPAYREPQLTIEEAKEGTEGNFKVCSHLLHFKSSQGSRLATWIGLRVQCAEGDVLFVVGTW